MSSFDEKIKQMAKSDIWDIPSNIDNKINNCLNALEEKKPLRKRPLKVAIILAALVVSTAVTGFAVEQVINYFKHNENSAFISSKNEIEKLASSINLSAKDKGIEFKVDSISADGNYINIFYTIKSDKKIKDIYPDYEKIVNSMSYDNKEFILHPMLHVEANGKKLIDPERIEYEAKLISDYELKGISRVNAIHGNLEKVSDIKIYPEDIYDQRGNWAVNTKLDLAKSLEETYTYNVNKKGKIKMVYENYNSEGNDMEVEYQINVPEVKISPFGSQIVIENKAKLKEGVEASVNGDLALFDQNGKSLDILYRGGPGRNPSTGIETVSYEFLKASKETKSLSLVPFSTEYGRELKVLEPKALDKFPISFKVNDYGSVIVEDFKITDKEIKITFYKNGLVPYNPSFDLFDEKGKRIDMGRSVATYSVDRHTGRHIETINLDKNFKYASKIKKISTSEHYIKLLDDQKIEINLADDRK